MRILIVIPAYNEELTIGSVVGLAKKYGYVLVVDDGSKDSTSEVAQNVGAIVIRHEVNKGGTALKTGFDYALANCYVVVTLDADGQHNPDEIPLLLKPILEGEADLVIGSRYLNGLWISGGSIMEYQKDIKPEDVTILVPTKNEEEAIGWVIEEFQKLGYYNILVIDGHSTDRTREIAKEKGAKVVLQSGRGKGQAVAEALKMIESEVVVMIDGDGTYDPKDVEKLLEPIRRGIADHVIGNRLVNFEKGAFTRLNLIGNKIFNALFRFLYGVPVYDMLTGYRALTKDLYKSVELEKHGFEVETELTVETVAKGFRIAEVPINYYKRKGSANLHPIKDGWRIGKAIIEMLVRYNPAKYLYFLGGIFLLLGLITGIYVVYEWLHRIPHDLLAIVVAILVLGGVQFIAVGFVMSYMFKSMAELKRMMRETTNRKLM